MYVHLSFTTYLPIFQEVIHELWKDPLKPNRIFAKNVMGILKSSKYIETDVNFKNNIIMYITPQLIEFHKKYISFMFM